MFRQQLGQFATWMEARGTPTVADINVPTVELFVVQLRRKATRYSDHPFAPEREGSLSSHTVHAGVRALRAFCTWLHQSGYREENVLALCVRRARTRRSWTR